MKVYLLRGVPGCGKSTFVHKESAKYKTPLVCSADHFFNQNGSYKFDPRKLGQAHGQCLSRFEAGLKDPKVDAIFVDNTNIRYEDIERYINKCRDASVDWVVVSFAVDFEQIGDRNVHGVGKEFVWRMWNGLQKQPNKPDWPVMIVKEKQ